MAGRLVDGIRIGPLSEETQGLIADFVRQLLVDGDTDHAGSVLLTTEAEGTVDETTQHERRPSTLIARVKECGHGRTAGLKAEVMDGTDGFISNHRGLVVHEAGNRWVEATAEGNHRGEAYGGVVILGHGIEGHRSQADEVDGERPCMAKHRVLISVFAEHRQDFRQILIGSKTAGSNGGKGTHAKRGVENQLTERKVVTLERAFLEDADGLRADFGVSMAKQGQEALGGGDAISQRGDRRGLAIKGFARSDGSTTTGEDTEPPDSMNALERISGLRRGLKPVSGVGTTGQFNLGTETDALVVMG